MRTKGGTVNSIVPSASLSGIFCAHFGGVDPKRLAHRRAILVGLTQDGDKGADVRHVQPPGEVMQHSGALLAGAQLEPDQRELLGQHRVRLRDLARHARHRLVEPLPGLDADKQHVEGVRKAVLSGLPAIRDPALDQNGGHKERNHASNDGRPD
jgi:hypothetical protein